MRIDRSPSLDCATNFQLTQIVVENSLLPHPDVVARCSNPVFPTARVPAASRHRRYTKSDCGSHVLDDNMSPRLALLWAHGFARQTVAAGWQVAHVWDAVYDRLAFSHLANLAFVPKSLTRLTDSGGPAVHYLQYHAAEKYGWAPDGHQMPAPPSDYGFLKWRYLPDCSDPDVQVATQLAASNNRFMVTIRSFLASTATEAESN